MSVGFPVAVGSLSIDPLATEVHWKINAFSELPKLRYYFALSPHFQFQGQNWRLNLSTTTLSDNIQLSLRRKGPAVVGPKRTVKCHFGVKHSHHLIGSKDFKMVEEFPEYQYQTMLGVIPGSELQKEKETLLPGDQFTFFCRLSVEGTSTTKETSTETTEDTDDNDLIILSQNLKNLYVEKKHCDVTINVKKETFVAHRAILGARTPVLEAMFSHDMAEAGTGVICVEDCDSKAFEVFLMFVYSGKVDLTSENVIPVYYVADKYDVPGLKKECVRYMMSNLAIDTICGVISMAKKHDEKVLLEEATEFFLRNAQEIFLTSLWEKFMAENTTQANELIVSSFKYVTIKASSQCRKKFASCDDSVL